MGKLNRLLITIMTVGFVLGLPDFATAQSGPITIASGEWQLQADWQDHTGATKRGTVLLLHKAAGNRAAYGRMATVLAEHGYASLRIDLRGHGDSTNVRAFDPNISRYKDENDPAVSANFELIDEGYIDIVAAIRWLDQQGKLHGAPFAVIGSATPANRWLWQQMRPVSLTPTSHLRPATFQTHPSGKWTPRANHGFLCAPSARCRFLMICLQRFQTAPTPRSGCCPAGATPPTCLRPMMAWKSAL